MVKRIPPQLVGDIVQLLERLAAEAKGLVRRRDGFEGGVGAGGQDAVEPGLLVFVARRGEGGARELFGVEAEGRFLRGVMADGESAGDGFGSGGRGVS